MPLTGRLNRRWICRVLGFIFSVCCFLIYAGMRGTSYVVNYEDIHLNQNVKIDLVNKGIPSTPSSRRETTNSATKEITQTITPIFTTVNKLVVDSRRQSVFDKIYKKKVWGIEGNGSGPGSTTQYTTVLRNNLHKFITKHNLTSMGDIPCGAMVWTEVFLNSIWRTKPSFRYVGMDITKSVVENLHRHWWNNSRVTIRQVDLVSSVPNLDVDFVLTRDALQHMPLVDACRAIDNLIGLNNNVKYLLLGTYPETPVNRNIKTGRYFVINLTKKPFNLPKPYLDYAEKKDIDLLNTKHIYVYKKEDLVEKRCQICPLLIKRNYCENKSRSTNPNSLT